MTNVLSRPTNERWLVLVYMVLGTKETTAFSEIYCSFVGEGPLSLVYNLEKYHLELCKGGIPLSSCHENDDKCDGFLVVKLTQPGVTFEKTPRERLMCVCDFWVSVL